MGIAERKEREKAEMRGRILEAATKMFLEDGYEKTSIRNIADAIEYSPATIYLYFKDKDELFHAIHEIGFEMLLKEMEQLGKIKNPLKRLHALGALYIEFALKNPEYYDLMFIIRAPMDALKAQMDEKEGCWRYGEITFQLLEQTVQECVDQKLIRSKNAKLAAVYTWSAVHGLVSLQIRDRYKILEMTPEQTRQMIMACMNELIDLMKA